VVVDVGCVVAVLSLFTVIDSVTIVVVIFCVVDAIVVVVVRVLI
jgi:hypothetical protein